MAAIDNLKEAIEGISTNWPIIGKFVSGGPTDTVETGAGETPVIAKVVQDATTALDQAKTDLITQKDAEINRAADGVLVQARSSAADSLQASGRAATSATAAADMAAAAAQQVSIGAAANRIFATKAAGIAGTTGGQYFYVPSTKAQGSYDVWTNTAGAAIFTGITLPNLAAVTAIQGQIAAVSGSTDLQLTCDLNGNVVQRIDKDGTQYLAGGLSSAGQINANNFFNFTQAQGATPYISIIADGLGNVVQVLDGAGVLHNAGGIQSLGPITGSALTAQGPLTGFNFFQFTQPNNVEQVVLLIADAGGGIVSKITADASMLTPSGSGGGSGGAESIIIDTDMDTDCDDAGDIAACFMLQKQGRMNVLGIVTDDSNPYAAPACRSIADFYNKTSLPIGAYQGTDARNGDNGSGSSVAGQMAIRFRPAGETRAAYPSSLTVYQNLLMAATSPVSILGLGVGDALYELLMSSGGNGIPSGVALIQSKVKCLYVSAGIFPNSAAYGASGPGGWGNPEANFARSAAKWNYICANWPGQIVFVGAEQGYSILTAPAFSLSTVTNPVRFSFYQHGHGNVLRPSWSIPLIYQLAYGVGQFVDIADQGTASVDATTGANSWVSSATGNHFYVIKRASDASFAFIHNQLISAAP
jgi:hypothetical protein